MAKTIIEDVANKDKHHELKHLYWEQNSVYWERYPLPVGDYIFYNELVADVISRKQKRGIPVKKMDFLGTYDVCVDTKFSIQELIQDLTTSHERFRDEAILAQNNGIKLYILVENKGGEIYHTGIHNKTVRSINDLFSWKNERLFIMKNSGEIIGTYKNGKPKYKKIQKYPYATKGQTLAKQCITFSERYGCEFVFCTPEESGQRIMELLSGGKKDE